MSSSQDKTGLTGSQSNPSPQPSPLKGEGDQGSSSTIDVSSPYTPRRPSPIVSISINHPIAQAARKIKNFFTHKQTLFSTTFTIKVTPIVALVSIFGLLAVFGGGVTTAFNFGKTVEQRLLASLSPTPAPQPTPLPSPKAVTVSLAGTIKSTYLLPTVTLTPTPVILNASEESHSTDSSAIVSPTAFPTPTPTPLPTLHYILVSRSGSINYLSASSSVHLQNYVNLRVLITGSFDSSKNTLTVSKPSDIEVLE